MRNFIANEYGRILVIHLGKGELLLESIQKALDAQGIRNAVLLSAIGSLRKLSMHIIMDTDDNATIGGTAHVLIHAIDTPLSVNE